METLPYALPNLPDRRRRPRWIDALVWTACLPTVALLVIALPPAWGWLDFTRKIPLHEVIAYDFSTETLRNLATSPKAIWSAFSLPLAFVVLMKFSNRRTVRASIVLASLAAAMPVLWLGPFAPFAPIMIVYVPQGLLGNADGEDWLEGMVAIGLGGIWMLAWITTLVIVLTTKKSWPQGVP